MRNEVWIGLIFGAIALLAVWEGAHAEPDIKKNVRFDAQVEFLDITFYIHARTHTLEECQEMILPFFESMENVTYAQCVGE